MFEAPRCDAYGVRDLPRARGQRRRCEVDKNHRHDESVNAGCSHTHCIPILVGLEEARNRRACRGRKPQTLLLGSSDIPCRYTHASPSSLSSIAPTIGTHSKRQDQHCAPLAHRHTHEAVHRRRRTLHVEREQLWRWRTLSCDHRPPDACICRRVEGDELIGRGCVRKREPVDRV